MTINRSLNAALFQYQKAQEKAAEIFWLFEDADEQELLRAVAQLNAEVESLLKLTGINWEQCGGLGRHLNFLDYYLKRNEKQNCEADIRDVLITDLPTTLRNIVELGQSKYLDAKLRAAVFPLLDGAHYDSAIRKTFVIVTDRLRRTFGIADQLDGEELINLVFGKGGAIPVTLNEANRVAMRNLISGFYGVYRNRYAHNDEEATAADANAIVEMANQILSEIERVANDSANIDPAR